MCDVDEVCGVSMLGADKRGGVGRGVGVGGKLAVCERVDMWGLKWDVDVAGWSDVSMLGDKTGMSSSSPRNSKSVLSIHN